MKKLIICIFFLSMAGGYCFSQRVSDTANDLFIKGLQLLEEEKWSEAFFCLKTAADKGNSNAMYYTGQCYERGEGVSVDFEKAFNYTYKAATCENPCVLSYVDLGKYYRNGLGTTQDYAEALRWFHKGAKDSPSRVDYKPECMFFIGIAYLFGEGIQQDYTQAVYWFREAAELGHNVAAHNLGNRYMVGQGVKKDEKEGVKWWRKAAEWGYADAQYQMGVVYLEGMGHTPIDKSIAKQWFEKAAAQGNTKSLIKLIELEER